MTEVRAATAADLDAIVAIHRAAFGRDAEATLVRKLVDAGRATVSLVAVDDEDTVIGHVLLSPVSIEEGDDGKSLGLAPVAVHPDHQRQGIGHALIEEGIGACFVQDARAIFVLGSPAYYTTFGFGKASAHGLHDASEGGNAFQVLPLTIEGLTGYRGRVDYAPEFTAGDL
ncbi:MULTISPECIES: GNAT family N-acetyltransferase [Rhodanobacteraceae]|jgi:putative acetyltransferase|uniref:GNAT family N-acetyltransferase n=1 Tax=Rhodanobacteraceae TaxID=1775411 RepID=UPI00056A8694|nr:MULTISPECIES: N-acetyltransferase [Rhodanobacteraceae]MDQ8048320.1 N-acetyltransferase [Luteibacter sp.]MDR6643657.1 putative acetyltransferase [Luteibacter sp. 1214]SDG62857.1 putative acetyltransferase [Dyella sp. 333MFSha]